MTPKKRPLRVSLHGLYDSQKPEFFLCTNCSLSFTSKSALRRHFLMTHDVDELKKLYNCDLCDKVFKAYYLLSAHKRDLHEKKRVCRYCTEFFHYNYQREDHERIEHPLVKRFDRYRISLRCPYCDVSAGHLGIMGKHLFVEHGEPGLMDKLLRPI